MRSRDAVKPRPCFLRTEAPLSHLQFEGRVSLASRIDKAESFQLRCLCDTNFAQVRRGDLSDADLRLRVFSDSFPSVGN